MKQYTLFLFTIIAAFLQGPMFSMVCFEGIVLVLFLGDKELLSFRLMLGVFLSGLLFDLIQGSYLGLTSFIFLIFSFVFLIMKGSFGGAVFLLGFLLVCWFWCGDT